MEVAFYDPNLPDGVDLATGFRRMASLTDLAEMADSLSVHALNATTAKLIDQTVFQAMKPSAVLINTARGPIVDVDALYVALRDNHIAGAGLDVWPVEPPAADHPLLAAYGAGEAWLAGRFLLSPMPPSTARRAYMICAARRSPRPPCGCAPAGAELPKPGVSGGVKAPAGRVVK